MTQKDLFAKVLRFKRWWIALAVVLVVYSVCVGLLVPWLIQKQATSLLKERLDLNLEVERLSIHPFSLYLQIEGLSVAQTGHEPLIAFDRFFVNLQSSSIFRRAITLDALQLIGVRGKLQRFENGDNTLSELHERWLASATEEEAPSQVEPEEDAALPRFLVRNIHFTMADFKIVDRSLPTHFEGAIGPVDIQFANLSSLANSLGEHHFDIYAQDGIEIRWRGKLDIPNQRSEGAFSISGPIFTTAYEYLQDSVPVIVDKGGLSLNFNYRLAMNEELKAAISDIQLDVIELNVLDSGGQSLFELPSATVSGGILNWPEKTASVQSVSLDKGKVFAHRDVDGLLNFNHIMPASSNEPAATASAESTDEDSQNQAVSPPDWEFALQAFQLKGWEVTWRDDSLAEPVNESIRDINLKLAPFKIAHSTPLELNYDMHVLAGQVEGRANATLWAQQMVEDIQWQSTIKGIELSRLSPYVGQFAKAAVTDGRLNLDMSLAAPTLSALNAEANVDVEAFAMASRGVEGMNDHQVARWQNLSISGINAVVDESQLQALKIKSVNWLEPQADFAIERDGTTTLDRLIVQRATENESSSTTDVTDSDDTESDSPAELQLKIGRIEIANAGGKFTDESLPLPFSTKVHGLSGYVSTIDNQSQALTDVEFKGALDEYGALDINGQLTPFNWSDSSELKANFRNVDIPSFSPYAVKFAGRKIDSGKLGLDLGYSVKEQRLVGSNKMTLGDFTLGEVVDQESALNLPLDMAIALLKDSRGVIKLDLPVNGEVDDPSFRIGPVIGQALRSVITSVVTSPFRLLGNLAGVKGDSLSSIHFEAGSAELAPPEREKMVALAEALNARPNLNLVLPPVYDELIDRQALQRAQLENTMELALGSELAAHIAERKVIKWLEKEFESRQPAVPLEALQEKAVVDKDGRQKRDDLVYARLLKSELIASEAVAKAQFTELALARAEAVQAALLAARVPEARLKLEPPEMVKAKDDAIIMKFKLEANTH